MIPNKKNNTHQEINKQGLQRQALNIEIILINLQLMKKEALINPLIFDILFFFYSQIYSNLLENCNMIKCQIFLNSIVYLKFLF